MWRRFDPYHRVEEPRERRTALVRLHSEGWIVKAIAGYLKINRDTVYETLKRFIEEGEAGLEDKKRGRPKGVSKVDLKAIDAVRRLQKNPNLGEFRIHAALAQIGIHLSPRTCGRILAINRRLYGYEKPIGAGGSEKEPMPFASSRRHEYWSAYPCATWTTGYHRKTTSTSKYHPGEPLSRDPSKRHHPLPGHTSAFLSVLYEAVEGYGSPEIFVTDSGGSVLRANRAQAIHEALNIRKEEIERGKPWQNYVETTHFNIQRRMADYHFSVAESWPELLKVHEEWVSDYNEQSHWAHRERKDGRRSPQEVLGWVTGVRYRPEDLERAFFSIRFSRMLDPLGRSE